MTRVRRYLFGFAAVVSAGLFLFVFYNWASSRYQVRRGDTGLVLIAAFWGNNDLRNNSDAIGVPAPRVILDSLRGVILNRRGGKTSTLIGFEYIRDQKEWMIVLPYWFLLLTTAVVPAFWLWRWNQTRRRKHDNQCSVCGYDMRATPDRCPECGTTRQVPK